MGSDLEMAQTSEHCFIYLRLIHGTRNLWPVLHFEMAGHAALFGRINLIKKRTNYAKIRQVEG